MRRVAILVLLALALATLASCQVEGERPNIILIITDDQRWDAVGEFMPITQARIFDQGVYFPNAYVTTPLCCPSRASILTGMYAHNHGVRRNKDQLFERTFVEGLHAEGYFTGMVGRYLNSWDGSFRPEFDFWAALAGGDNFSYLDPELNINGSWEVQEGYITTILRDYALGFLGEALKKNRPFFLMFAPNAPHWPARPAPGDGDLYLDLPLFRPPNYNERDLSDKPQLLQGVPFLTTEQQGLLDRLRRKQLATLKSVDEAIGSILDLLETGGRLDNTVIFFISDNGFFWGEHRLGGNIVRYGRQGKNWVYEPAVRVPFALRYPRLVPQGLVDDRLVANIDIAPTIYQLAGLSIPAEVDGQSLVSLVRGEGEWREAILLEAWPTKHPSWAAVHTVRYVYVETEGDLPELYDLEEDPYQLQNLAYDPGYAEVVAEMRERLRRLRGG